MKNKAIYFYHFKTKKTVMKTLNVTREAKHSPYYSPNQDEYREIVNGNGSIIIRVMNDKWGFYISRKECEANANLIVDAFETANKSQKLPSQILSERDGLIEALDEMIGIATSINKGHKDILTDMAKRRIAYANILLTKINNK